MYFWIVFKSFIMKTIIFLNLAGPLHSENLSGYLIGAIIGILILGYLIYSLIKPEKF